MVVADTLVMVVSGRVDEVRRLHEAIETFCHARAVSAAAAYRVLLAVEELLTNLIWHGSVAEAEAGASAHQATVTVRHDDHGLLVTFEDDGRPFDPLSAPAPDFDLPLEERRVGGLGVHLFRTLFDEVRYERAGDRNRTTLTLRLSSSTG